MRARGTGPTSRAETWHYPRLPLPASRKLSHTAAASALRDDGTADGSRIFQCSDLPKLRYFLSLFCERSLNFILPNIVLQLYGVRLSWGNFFFKAPLRRRG